MATGLGSYSTTPLTNGAASSQISMVEGMPPSAVNDGIRQIMADVALWLRDAGWIEFKEYTWTYASATSVTVAGVDVTAYFPAGRAVRAVGNSTGTIYGKVRASSFSTNTTINFEWDSGSLSNETLAISVSVLSTTGQPVSSDFTRAVNMSKATDVTASSSMNVWSVLGNSFNMPGTATISAFSDAPRPGAWRFFRNTGSKIFVNSANLILPTASDYTATVGEMGLIWAEGTATFVVSFFRVPSDAVVLSHAYAEYTGDATISAVIPLDDTVPLISEGEEILSLTFAPTSASSRIRFRFQGLASTVPAGAATAALFVNSDVSAIAVTGVFVPSANQTYPLVLEYEAAAVSATAKVYHVRVGPAAATVLNMNRGSGARLYGGVARATLTIDEID